MVVHPLSSIEDKHFVWGLIVNSLSCQGCIFSKVKECTKVRECVQGSLNLLQNSSGHVVGVTFLKRFPACGHFPSDCMSHVVPCNGDDWFTAS